MLSTTESCPKYSQPSIMSPGCYLNVHLHLGRRISQQPCKLGAISIAAGNRFSIRGFGTNTSTDISDSTISITEGPTFWRPTFWSANRQLSIPYPRNVEYGSIILDGVTVMTTPSGGKNPQKWSVPNVPNDAHRPKHLCALMPGQHDCPTKPRCRHPHENCMIEWLQSCDRCT